MVTLALAGCAPDQPVTTPSSGHKTPVPGSTSKAGTQDPTPTPSPSSAGLKVLDPALITKDVGTLSGAGVKAQVFNLPKAMGLGLSLDVVRNHVLRARAQSGSTTPLTIEQQVLASSPDTVLVQVTAQGGAALSGTASVVYDRTTNTALTSAALIRAGHWADLTAAVGQAGGDAAAKLTALMGQPQWPYGAGPALAFAPTGDLVVTFAAITDQAPLTLPADQVKGWLTPLGLKAQAATASPAAYGPSGPPKITPSGKSSSTPSASSSADPQTKGGRPSLVVGPDCTQRKCVALTFDDGPVPETKDLLKQLTKLKVPATFFVLGTSVDQDPALVTATALAGQHVAAHNQTHNQMSHYSPSRLDSELRQITSSIRKATGQAPFFLRPPYGDRNAKVDAAVGKYGMVVTIWDVDTMDWKVSGQGGAEGTIVGNVNQQTTNGSIILMHDIHATSRAAVPAVVASLKGKGYTLVTMSELGPANLYYAGQRVCRAPQFAIECGW